MAFTTYTIHRTPNTRVKIRSEEDIDGFGMGWRVYEYSINNGIEVINDLSFWYSLEHAILCAVTLNDRGYWSSFTY